VLFPIQYHGTSIKLLSGAWWPFSLKRSRTRGGVVA
jgi:hypothetical protein